MRILVVDSYGWSGQALRRLLVLHGYEAQWAASVADALRLCETQNFDLLICELRLPDGSGGQLLRTLIERCGLRGISITTDPTETATRESHKAGFDAHFLKPLSFDVLCGTIHRLEAARA